jgi:hypothetical protein
MPALSKMRGVLTKIKQLKEDGYRDIGVQDTLVSKAGWGVAVICKELGLRCHVYIPREEYDDNWLTESAKQAMKFDAEIVPVLVGGANRMFDFARAMQENINGGYMLPKGLRLKETILETANVVTQIPIEFLTGTIVIPAGTGTITMGILLGLHNAHIVPQKILSVVASMNENRIYDMLEEYKMFFGDFVILNKIVGVLQAVREGEKYSEPSQAIIPWPAHPNYEGKAFDCMVREIEFLKKSVLFWNVGS